MDARIITLLVKGLKNEHFTLSDTDKALMEANMRHQIETMEPGCERLAVRIALTEIALESKAA